MKKANYILLLTGIVIMTAGIFVFGHVNIGAILLSGFIGATFLIGGVVFNASQHNKNEKRKLAYVRARR